MKANVSVIRCLQNAIGAIDTTVLQQSRLRPEFKPLLSVTGIGDILGLTIMLENGDMGRFAKVDHYASYCRCVKSERLSNNKKKGEGNRKSGNKYLAWARYPSWRTGRSWRWDFGTDQQLPGLVLIIDENRVLYRDDDGNGVLD